MQIESQINEQVFHRFLRMKEKKQLAHAYLFIGQKDIGKRQTGIAIAKYLNCEQKLQDSFCDQCPSCQKIDSGNHPDIHVLECDFGETIKIQQVRSLLGQEQLRPFCGEKKIFILTNVENLTLEAANALLKTLEEPSANSLLILTTSLPGKVLETIKSRCHAVFFAPIPRQDFLKRLTKDQHAGKEEARFLSYLSQGCMGKAMRLKEEGVFGLKSEVLEQFILSRDSEDFMKQITKDKYRTKYFLDILLIWIRDAILMQSGVDLQQLVYQDKEQELKDFQGHYSFQELKELYDEIVKVSKLLVENLNVKIPLLIIKEKLWAR